MPMNKILKIGFFSMLMASLMLSGCAESKQSSAISADSKISNGPQLWAENCFRCHNSRSPEMYSNAQWEVVVMHMRVRANLSEKESQEILAFLKSSR